MYPKKIKNKKSPELQITSSRRTAGPWGQLIHLGYTGQNLVLNVNDNPCWAPTNQSTLLLAPPLLLQKIQIIEFEVHLLTWRDALGGGGSWLAHPIAGGWFSVRSVCGPPPRTKVEESEWVTWRWHGSRGQQLTRSWREI